MRSLLNFGVMPLRAKWGLRISVTVESRGRKVSTLYNVCSVHRGMFSTSGGVQYIGGIP